MVREIGEESLDESCIAFSLIGCLSALQENNISTRLVISLNFMGNILVAFLMALKIIAFAKNYKNISICIITIFPNIKLQFT